MRDVVAIEPYQEVLEGEADNCLAEFGGKWRLKDACLVLLGGL